jgi:predicted protein tyrosine phosphatase
MRVRVLSKLKFDELLPRIGVTNDNADTHKNLAFISIVNSDTKDSFFKENKSNVLKLTFDDATDEENNRRVKLGLTELQLFTPNDGKKIIEFMENNLNSETVYIHCSAGRSRSGAVGTFINDVWGEQIFHNFLESNPIISPNYFILALLRRIYNNIEYDN